MSESTNITAQTEEVPQSGESLNSEEKTFTQDELNRIVSERLQKERKKLKAAETGEYTAELAEREQDILQRELKMDAKERLIEAGLPTSVTTLLCYDDEDTYHKSLDNTISILNEIISPAVENQVREALKGNTPKAVPKYTSDPIKAAFAPKE